VIRVTERSCAEGYARDRLCCRGLWWCMGRGVHELREVEKLLEAVEDWSEEELDELPKLYREKVREYRGLLNSGEG